MLRPFASRLWWCASEAGAAGAREHVLPTGHMHLVFRLAGPALRIFSGAQDGIGSTIREPVIGGPRSAFYVKQSGVALVSIGAQLLPGAARALFGPGAGEFAAAHTGLSAVWGAGAERALQQLLEAGGPDRQLAMLDRLLCARLGARLALPAQVAQALRAMDGASRIGDLVRASDYSHRAFIALFRAAAGMSPKSYARIVRCQQVLAGLRSPEQLALGQLAFDAGYSDQSHMTREFSAFSGLSPGAYRALAPAAAHHVILG